MTTATTAPSPNGHGLAALAGHLWAAWSENGVVKLTSRKTGVSEELVPAQAVARLVEIYAGV